MEISDIKFTIQRQGAEPVWLQIKQLLIQCITQGIWKPGQMIANEHTLFETFEVSIGTIRKAVSELEQEGILIRKQGVGTFVTNHDNSSFLYKYFHIMPDGEKKSFPATTLLAFKSRKAKKAEAAVLQISDKTAKVFAIRNLLSVKNYPCIVDDIVLCASQFPLLNEEIFRTRTGTIYSLYQDRFGIFIVRISESVKAIAAPQDIAEALGVTQGTPLLQISRTSYTFNDVPVELRTSYVHTSHVEYRPCSDQESD